MRQCCALLFIISMFCHGLLADSGFEMMYTADEWCRFSDSCGRHDDVVVLKNGHQLMGYFEELPPIHYSFASIDFEPCELSGFSLAYYQGSPKLQYVMRNGQNFIGEQPHEPFIFYEKEIEIIETEDECRECITYHRTELEPNRVSYARFKDRQWAENLIADGLHSLVLRNGDRFPVEIVTTAIHLANKREQLAIHPRDLASLKNAPNAQIFVRTEAVDRALAPIQVMDHSLYVRLAKNKQELHIPWDEISELRGDMGMLIMETPYHFALKDPHDMVLVPAGSFIRHSNEELLAARTVRGSLGGQRQSVEVGAFLIDRAEVSNAQYRIFVEATGHPVPPHWDFGRIPKGLAGHPVINVTYADAEAYAKWAGKRLPTADEWERAARGAFGEVYPYGNAYSSQAAQTERKGTAPVGSYPQRTDKPAKWAKGIQDLSGNVAEWTASLFEETRPDFRVVKGGSFASSRHTSTAHYRGRKHERDLDIYTGFRCVRDPS